MKNNIVFLSLLGLTFSFSKICLASDSINQLVRLDCKTAHQTDGYSGIFFLKSYEGQAYRGFRVEVSDALPIELKRGLSLSGDYKEAIQGMIKSANKYNTLACEAKVLTFSRSSIETIYTCGPGSEVSFSPSVWAYSSVTIKMGEQFGPDFFGFDRKLQGTEVPAVENGTFNACDSFRNQIRN